MEEEAKKKKWFRYCIVPNCTNNGRITPDKLFFCVPRDTKTRKKWCKLLKRSEVSPKSCLYCCEDHFNVEEDAENYIKYKLLKEQGIKVNPRLKKGVVPHIFKKQKQKRRNAPIKQRSLCRKEVFGNYSAKTSHDLESEVRPQDNLVLIKNECSGENSHDFESEVKPLGILPLIKEECSGESSHDFESEVKPLGILPLIKEECSGESSHDFESEVKPLGILPLIKEECSNESSHDLESEVKPLEILPLIKEECSGENSNDFESEVEPLGILPLIKVECLGENSHDFESEVKPLGIVPLIKKECFSESSHDLKIEDVQSEPESAPSDNIANNQACNDNEADPSSSDIEIYGGFVAEPSAAWQERVWEN